MSKFRFFILVIFIFISSCSHEVKDVHNNIFRYNEAASITSLDPVFSNNQSNIWATNQIFNTLLELDSNMHIKPSIAKEWNVSNDGLVYTFLLRNDVFYHKSPCFGKDSTRLLNAFDFQYSVSRLANQNLLSPGRWVLDYFDLGDINILNDSILEIQLERPFPGLLGLLTMNYFAFVPKEAVEYYGDSFSQNPIGTGPFYFKYWKQNDKLIFLKNTNYFEYENNIRLPYLDGISISFITQKESVFMNFILGNFDFVSGLDNSFRDEFLSSNGNLLDEYSNSFYLITTPYLNTEYLAFNLNKAKQENSPLISKDFRKALNYSFDRSMMTQYLRNGLVSPANKGFVPTVLSNCYDVDGFFYSPDSVNYFLKKVPNRNQSIVLHTTQDYLDICEYIQYNAKNFGINISIEISSPPVHRELFSSGESSFFRASWIGDYPDPENYLSLFYSKNKSPFGPNYTHFDNPLYDSLYQMSFLIEDQQARCSLFSQMESILIDEAVIMPLYYDYVVRLVSKDITGMSLNAMNSLSLKHVQKKFSD